MSNYKYDFDKFEYKFGNHNYRDQTPRTLKRRMYTIWGLDYPDILETEEGDKVKIDNKIRKVIANSTFEIKSHPSSDNLRLRRLVVEEI